MIAATGVCCQCQLQKHEFGLGFYLHRKSKRNQNETLSQRTKYFERAKYRSNASFSMPNTLSFGPFGGLGT